MPLRVGDAGWISGRPSRPELDLTFFNGTPSLVGVLYLAELRATASTDESETTEVNSLLE